MPSIYQGNILNNLYPWLENANEVGFLPYDSYRIITDIHIESKENIFLNGEVT